MNTVPAMVPRNAFNRKYDTLYIRVTSNPIGHASQRSFLDAVFMDGRDNSPAMTMLGNAA